MCERRVAGVVSRIGLMRSQEQRLMELMELMTVKFVEFCRICSRRDAHRFRHFLAPVLARCYAATPTPLLQRRIIASTPPTLAP